jgi:hypothetical protein
MRSEEKERSELDPWVDLERKDVQDKVGHRNLMTLNFWSSQNILYD